MYKGICVGSHILYYVNYGFDMIELKRSYSLRLQSHIIKV